MEFYKYVLIFVILSAAGYIGNEYKKRYEHRDEYILIKKFLLNDVEINSYIDKDADTSHKYKKPKIWIHTKYDYNSRKWQNFQSRSSYDLNQPYIDLTVKSIVNTCGNDFHICLINDESFRHLIPSWNVDIENMQEPFKTQYREIGILTLLYYYGGIVVPNSFLCTKSLLPLHGKAFMFEKTNRTSINNLFIGDSYFMGSDKKNPDILRLVENLSENVKINAYSIEFDFKKHQHIQIMDGSLIGIKTSDGKPILLENLLEEYPLDLIDGYGIYIPQDELLVRTKYQWFSVLSIDELMKSNMIISHYFRKYSIDKEEYREHIIKSIM